MKLKGDSTHFSCEGCGKIRLVEEGHITKVAFSLCNINTQDKFSQRPFWVMLCAKCFECKEEEKKDDIDNNTK